MAYTFAKYMARHGIKSSSILAMNNDFGRGAANAYKAAFEKSNIKLASTEFFDPGQPDYRPVLTRLKRAGAETILGVILASDGAPFMRQYHELGLTQKVFSRGSLVSAEFLHQVASGLGVAVCLRVPGVEDGGPLGPALAGLGPHRLVADAPRAVDACAHRDVPSFDDGR